MEIVFLTAIGVGGATLIGALFGFAFQKISHRFGDTVLGFAAGVMLAAAVIGLILPSLEKGGGFAVTITVGGVFCGALLLNVVDRLVPHLHRLTDVEYEEHTGRNSRIDKVMLFVFAIAIHNFPEGIAAGVGFGSGNRTEALIIAGGIALQNIPEGMVLIAPMMATGIGKKRTFCIAAMTGLIEVIGTLLGYFTVRLSTAVLPFALAFAGGTMLYIISDELIPETHAHGNERSATYALLLGFCLMLAVDYYFG